MVNNEVTVNIKKLLSKKGNDIYIDVVAAALGIPASEVTSIQREVVKSELCKILYSSYEEASFLLENKKVNVIWKEPKRTIRGEVKFGTYR